MNNRRCFILLLSVLAILLSSCERNFTSDLNILSVHALKGQIFAEEQESGARKLGFSLLSSQAADLRRGFEKLSMFVADNNSIHGTPEAYFSRGMHVITLLNSVKCDVLVVDSRELYFGEARLEELSKAADFPFISANIRERDSGKVPEYLEPYYYNPQYNVLLIGLSSPSLISRNLPINVANLELRDSALAIREALELFKEQQDQQWQAGAHPFVERPFIMVNAVSHKLSDTDRKLLLDEIDDILDIDILLMGERDLAADGLIGKSSLPAGIDPVWADRLVLVDDERSDNGGFLDNLEVRNTEARRYSEFPLTSDKVQPDNSISELIFTIREASQAQLSSEIARSEAELVHQFSGDSPVANVLTDIIRSYTGADLALVNSGMMRGRLEQGVITLYDIYEILPFEAGLYLQEIPGRQILNLLNNSVGRYMDPELEKGFLQWSGLTYHISEDSASYWIQAEDVRVLGEPLDLSRVYSVALTGYLHAGGDGYPSFQSFPILREYPETMFSIFLRYINGKILRNSEINPRVFIKEKLWA